MYCTLIALTGLLSFAAAKTGNFAPHVQYSSSLGVLGCKIDTNRVAYLPYPPGCDNLCLKVTYQGRSLNILHVDQSGGSYDISADAFTYLVTGHGAKGTTVPSDRANFDYDVVAMEQCNDLIHTDGNKMPIMAVSPTSVVNCKANSPGSYLANNYTLINYANSCCTLGEDKVCTFPVPYYGGAQPTCPGSTLGLQTLIQTTATNIDMNGNEVPAVC